MRIFFNFFALAVRLLELLLELLTFTLLLLNLVL